MTERLFFFKGKMVLDKSIIKNTAFDLIFDESRELAFKSNVFKDYNACVKDCGAMCQDIASKIKIASNKKLSVVWEPNPLALAMTSAPLVNSSEVKQWDINEIVRFYLIDLDEIDEQSINAPLMSSIYSVNDTGKYVENQTEYIS